MKLTVMTDSLYILISDDEPDDERSPQHYVLIHGILTAPVIYHLNETGVNVDAIICVKAQNYDSLTPTPVQQDENKDVDTSKVRLFYWWLCYQISLNSGMRDGLKVGMQDMKRQG